MTNENTESNKMKCVIVIHEDLPIGLIANTAAVIGMSIGQRFGHLIGPDVLDQNGGLHRGITQVPIPLLRGSQDFFRSIREKAAQLEAQGIFVVDVCDVAQKSKRYADYVEQMQQTPVSHLSYLGVGLFGPRKDIEKLTGSASLLR